MRIKRTLIGGDEESISVGDYIKFYINLKNAAYAKYKNSNMNDTQLLRYLFNYYNANQGRIPIRAVYTHIINESMLEEEIPKKYLDNYIKKLSKKSIVINSADDLIKLENNVAEQLIELEKKYVKSFYEKS